jgi:quercetin dioxygenase-like cupin family protein
MELNRKRQDTGKGPAERFAGEVWIDEIGATEHTTVMSVHFTPGARTAWHAHPHGQVLHVTEGAGLVQSRGDDREEIRAGDTVHAAPGEWHWHGAGPGTFMTHTAVQEGVTEWAEHVTDEDYRG